MSFSNIIAERKPTRLARQLCFRQVLETTLHQNVFVWFKTFTLSSIEISNALLQTLSANYNSVLFELKTNNASIIILNSREQLMLKRTCTLYKSLYIKVGRYQRLHI